MKALAEDKMTLQESNQYVITYEYKLSYQYFLDNKELMSLWF